MELYHKITKEVLELLLKEGAQMPVDLGRKLQRSSSNMQQEREYLSKIGCIFVTKQRNFYELKITEKGIQLLEAMRQIEMFDKPSKPVPIDPHPGPVFVLKQKEKPEEEEPPEIKAPPEPQPDPKLTTTDVLINRGGRRGILKRLG